MLSMIRQLHPTLRLVIYLVVAIVLACAIATLVLALSSGGGSTG